MQLCEIICYARVMHKTVQRTEYSTWKDLATKQASLRFKSGLTDSCVAMLQRVAIL